MPITRLPQGFHGHQTAQRQAAIATGLTVADAGTPNNPFRYRFHNHFHPYVEELLQKLNRDSIDGLLDADFHETLRQHFFVPRYRPNQEAGRLAVTGEPKQIDVSPDGAYAVYNRELFLHVPLTIAVHLSNNQRFADAQRWFHYIFDPTATDGKYWRYIGFRQDNGPARIDELLALVSRPDHELDAEGLRQKKLALSGYETLRRNPSQPHAVARTRDNAYRWHVVMKYLDNLIAWGDSLYRQATGEALAEATQLYVLASNLLGPRPERMPPRGRIRPRTFAQLRASGLDAFGNALEDLEAQFPFNIYMPEDGIDTNQARTLFGLGYALYFCIPRNDKLLGYWDLVEQRLFTLRHCMDIEGNVLRVPLFDASIDPALAINAAAAGIDMGSMVSGLNQPVAPVRAPVLIKMAREICGRVYALGAALLAALEKRDIEALLLLRQRQEIGIRSHALDARFLEWKAAEAATDTLVQSRERIAEKYRYEQRLLGNDKTDVMAFALERRELTADNFASAYEELVGKYAPAMDFEDYSPQTLPVSNAADAEPGEAAPNAGLTPREVVALMKSKQIANVTERAKIFYAVAGSLKALPQFKLATKAHPVGLGFSFSIEWGGAQVAAVPEFLAKILEARAFRIAEDRVGYREAAFLDRRSDEWRFESNLAAEELMLIGRQIITALIHEQVARHQYEILKKDIAQADEVRDFLAGKYTGEALYGWMQGELTRIYYDYYKLTFDIAKKAEQTMKHELMRPELDARSFVKFNYWDTGRKGLLAGEALCLDLDRMSLAYDDHNKREYELTRQISLRQLDPMALLALKANGVCEVTLPEWLFDLATPGHYMRRTKSLGLTIEAPTARHSDINCTVSLQRSSLRRSPLLRDGQYPRATDADDDRFIDYFGTVRSIVTSHAQDDSGLFEVDLREDRFLPFEGAGVISSWRLELPGTFRQFDYNTIDDVVLHLRHTARQGGAPLAQQAVESMRELFREADRAGLVRLFSLEHDFPTEWAALRAGETVSLTVAERDLPPFAQGHGAIVHRTTWLAGLSGSPAGVQLSQNGNTFGLDPHPTLAGLRIGQSAAVELDTEFTLQAENGEQLNALTLLVSYTLNA
jgi:hypothetical protein